MGVWACVYTRVWMHVLTMAVAAIRTIGISQYVASYTWFAL